MATVIFFWRGWGGLYNTPGSLEIARRYGQLASKRIYRGLFPGDTRDPSRLFGLDGKPGPRFLATQSGSLFEKTGHIGYLVARLARREPPEALVRELARTQDQRITTPASVTVIDLTHLGNSKPRTTIHPKLPYPSYGLFALIPTAISLLACLACAWFGDWWTFSSILWGMLANGCACFVLGRGIVTFQHPEPAPDAPPGDGILWAAENAVVVVRGSEHAVNAITRGRFFLQYDASPGGQSANSARPPNGAPPQSSSAPLPPMNSSTDGAQGDVGKEDDAKREPDSAPEGGAPNSLLIGLSGILLVVQFFAQLLLIPQVGLFGQVMFLLTVAASWGYNVLISSIDREDMQVRILRSDDILDLPKKPKANAKATGGSSSVEGGEPGLGRGWESVRKFEFGTWTAMAIFACLALRSKAATPLPLKSSSKILDALIPNDTDVWARWKEMVRSS